MQKTAQLADLILLAEKGMGWRQVPTLREVWGTDGVFAVDAGMLHIKHLLIANTTQPWDPWRFPADAMGLMCELEISVAPFQAGTVWFAAHTDGHHRAVGYTSETICTVISECALMVVRGRRSDS